MSRPRSRSRICWRSACTRARNVVSGLVATVVSSGAGSGLITIRSRSTCTTTVSGISYHYIVGGRGQVFAEIGHKIFVTDTFEVIFQGGQDDLASDPDLLSLCEFMA